MILFKLVLIKQGSRVVEKPEGYVPSGFLVFLPGRNLLVAKTKTWHSQRNPSHEQRQDIQRQHDKYPQAHDGPGCEAEKHNACCKMRQESQRPGAVQRERYPFNPVTQPRNV